MWLLFGFNHWHCGRPLEVLANYKFCLCRLSFLWVRSLCTFVLLLLKGGDSWMVSNYRPHSKLCTWAKILERLVNNHLKSYLDQSNILSQWGFRKVHSTLNCFFKSPQRQSWSTGCKKILFCSFYWLSKAFTTVDHGLLCWKWVFQSKQLAGFLITFLTVSSLCSLIVPLPV